jgi:hypothetical protein
MLHVRFLGLILLMHFSLQGCGRIGGNNPPPTPTPSTIGVWHRLLSENDGHWTGGGGEVQFLEEGRFRRQVTAAAEGSNGLHDDFAELGVVAEGRWTVSQSDSGEFCLVFRDAAGIEQQFRLGWMSGQGPLEFLTLERNDGSIALRRPKPRR